MMNHTQILVSIMLFDDLGLFVPRLPAETLMTKFGSLIHIRRVNEGFKIMNIFYAIIYKAI